MCHSNCLLLTNCNYLLLLQEDEVTACMAKARRSERDALDAQESLAVLQEENAKLRAAVRRSRLRREDLSGDIEVCR